jgi:hypothetical protein
MLSTIIILLGILAFLHFIYDGILLPFFHIQLKNRLFKLRDRVRDEQMKNEKIPQDSLGILHTSINIYLNYLEHIDLEFYVKLHGAYRNDKKFRNEIDQRVTVITGCSDEWMVSCFRELNSIIEFALIVNVGGWLIYLVPLAFLCSISNKVMKIMVIPSENAGQFITEFQVV